MAVHDSSAHSQMNGMPSVTSYAVAASAIPSFASRNVASLRATRSAVMSSTTPVVLAARGWHKRQRGRVLAKVDVDAEQHERPQDDREQRFEDAQRAAQVLEVVV